MHMRMKVLGRWGPRQSHCGCSLDPMTVHPADWQHCPSLSPSPPAWARPSPPACNCRPTTVGTTSSLFSQVVTAGGCGVFSYLLSWPHHCQGASMDDIHHPFLLPTFGETHSCFHSQAPFPAPRLKFSGDASICFFSPANLSAISPSSPPRDISAFPHRGRGGKKRRGEGGKEGRRKRRRMKKWREKEREKGKKEGGMERGGGDRKWKNWAFTSHGVTISITGHHQPQELSKDWGLAWGHDAWNLF